MPTIVYDRVGQEIVPGCFIAYGHALGRCAGLRIGRVETVNFKKVDEYDWEKQKNKKVEAISITVLGIDDDSESKKPHLLEKRSTLFFPSRMVVLNSLPEKYATLYETDCVALGGKHKWGKVKTYYKKCTKCNLNTDPW